jgi:hypothetical protein
MKGRIAISCSFSLLWLVFAVSRSDSQIDERIGVGTAVHTDTIDDYIKHEMALRKVPGLAFAMVDHGRIVTERTYGTANVETGSPVETDSVFELAAVTKPITAVAVMMLVEEGKIGLDDPISNIPSVIALLACIPILWTGIAIHNWVLIPSKMWMWRSASMCGSCQAIFENAHSDVTCLSPKSHPSRKWRDSSRASD